MSRKLKKRLRRILICLAAFSVLSLSDILLRNLDGAGVPSGLASLIPGRFGWLLPLGLFLAVYLGVGYDVLEKCFRNIRRGRIFDENFLMTLATLGAFALGIAGALKSGAPEGFDEACAVLLFYQIGEWFQDYAVGRSRASVSALMEIRPDIARVLRDGQMIDVSPEDVAVDERIVVNAGERIPLDGVICEGTSSVDTKALTGESLPVDVSNGDPVLSGSVNLTSRLVIRVTTAFQESTVSKILELVQSAAGRKSRAETFISRFARVYTPAVVVSALCLGVIPPLFAGGWSDWIYRALNFLVVSCPCALVISVPLTFVAGIGAASRRGVLIKGSDHLERMDRADLFVFDKTGTITEGVFSVTQVEPEERREEILTAAAVAEADSGHPIARSILLEAGMKRDAGFVSVNYAGMGIAAEKDGQNILCGNEKLMDRFGISVPPRQGAGTIVYVAKNGAYLGAIRIADTVRGESAQVLSALQRAGAQTVLFTGDGIETAEAVAQEVGFTRRCAQMLPQDKVAGMEALCAERKGKGAVCFVGDGINDAPVLMRADVGIAMGGVGSDAAIEAADIVLMRDDLRGILTAKRIARKTMRIVRQNVGFAIAVKIAILLLSAVGFADLRISVFGDVGVAVLAVCNALRAGMIKQQTENAV